MAMELSHLKYTVGADPPTSSMDPGHALEHMLALVKKGAGMVGTVDVGKAKQYMRSLPGA